MLSRVIENTTINFVLFFNLFIILTFFYGETRSPAILFAILFPQVSRPTAISKIVHLFGETHKKFMRTSKFSRRRKCVGRIYSDVVTWHASKREKSTHTRVQ